MMHVILIGAVALASVAFLRVHGRPTLFLPFLAVLGIAISRPLVAFGDTDFALHAGIAPAFPVIYTSAAVALVLLLATRGGNIGSSTFALAGWLIVVWLFLFSGSENSPAQWAGFVSFAVAVLCFACGRKLHGTLRVSSGAVAFAAAAFVFVAAELLLGTAQYLGIVALEASDQGLLRVRGTFGHAGDLGKAVVAASALALACLAVSKDRRTRQLVVGTVGLAFVVTGLSASRSNLAALVVLLVAWAMLAREPLVRRLGRRFLLLGGAAVLPFAGTYVLRFSADPDGGSRPELLRAALQQLKAHPFDGTGLNSYIQVVGLWDPRTASGLPVHNAFLLVAAEVGVPVFSVIMIIGIALVGRVVVRRSPEGSDLRAPFLAYALALIFIGLTGWGVLKVTVLPFMAFVFGLLVPSQEKAPPSFRTEEIREVADSA